MLGLLSAVTGLNLEKSSLKIMSKGIQLFFSGSVQGVGFRFKAQSLARRSKLTGWVKNLADGRVEIRAEGEREDLGLFLSRLKEEFGHQLTKLDSQDMPFLGEFNDFEIKF